MAAGSIIIDLLMRTGSFETNSKAAQKRLRELKKEAADAGKAIGAGIALAGVAFAGFVKSAIDSADAAGKSAQAAGLAVESYTALAYAAELSDVSAESLGASLKVLNKNIAENDKAFASLGISVRDSAGNLKNADAVLSEIADSFAAMPDGPEKSTKALTLLGKAGTQLIPLLNQGSSAINELKEEAKRLGVVISSDTAKAADEFNDNIERLQKTAKGLSLEIAKELLPALEKLSANVLKNAKDFGVLRGAAIAVFEAMLGGTEPADLLQKQIETTRESIKGLQEQIAISEKRGDSGAAGGQLDQMRKQLVALQAEAKKSTQSLVDVLNLGKTGGAGGGRGSVNPERVKFDGKPEADTKKQPVSEAQRYLETLQKQGEELKEMTALEKALNDIAKQRIDGLTPVLRKQILAQAELNDANRRAIEMRDGQVQSETNRARASLDTLDAMQKANAELREEISLIGLDELGIAGVERARTSSLRVLKEEERARREANGEAETTLQVLDAEILALREREELLGQKIGRGIEERSKDSMQKAGEKINDALADSIEQGILDGFRRGESLADIFLRELKAQFARTILRPIIQPVAEAGNQVIGQILGAIGNVVGGGMSIDTSGAGTISNPVIGRPRGGMDTGTDYVPRDMMAMLHKGEKVIPAKYTGQSEMKVVVNNTASDRVSATPQRNSDGQLEIMIRSIVRDETASDIRSGGGPISSGLKSRGVRLDGGLSRFK